MSERMTPGPICGQNGAKEAVCVHTNKITAVLPQKAEGIEGRR